MSESGPVWLVRATSVGFDVFREHGIVALNCLVRRDITGLAPQDIEASGTSRAHARELARVLHLDPGHLVIATHSKRRDVLIGTVLDLYEYRPDLVAEHPHTFAVTWGALLPRELLDAERIRWPYLNVRAITEIDLPPGALRLVVRAASGEQLGTPSRRTRSSGRTNPTVPVRRRAVGVCGAELLAQVPRRRSEPLTWVDDNLSSEQRIVPCPVGRCVDHTRHRYWLPIELPRPNPKGPNMLVVGVNPTCPDVDHPRNRTYQQVRRLAAGVGAASCCMVNIATRRTGDVAELLSVAGELVGPRHESMLRVALERADLVVLAHGRIPGGRRSPLHPLRSRLLGLVDEQRERGLVVAQIGEFPSHPWPWSTTVPGNEQALVELLCAV